MSANPYPANFTKASLLVPESRIIAGLLLQHPSKDEWKQQVFEENILQRRTRNSAQTAAGLIRSRLETMDEQLWSFVHKGSKELATQAVLTATVKFSPLLGDYIRLVYQPERKKFSQQLRPASWDLFVEDCHNRIPDLPVRTPATLAKLKQNAFRMLAEAGLIDNTRDMTIQNPMMAPELKAFLKQHNERYVLSCLLAEEI